jgi:mRNA interferase MazF
MASTTIYKQGDVLLVPFPFTDQSAVKQRPAVVLSSETYNRTHFDIILAPITSQLHGDSHEVQINDWESTGLLKSSAVKPVLASFDTLLVRKRLGALSDDDLESVRTLFRQILDL